MAFAHEEGQHQAALATGEQRVGQAGATGLDTHTATQPHRTLIAIGSGKGGVGKSTVAANLAVALAKAGKKIGLIDADVYGPSQPTLLGSHEKPTAENEKLIPVEAHGVKFLSLGQLMAPGHALAWRGPMATGALANLVEAEWGGSVNMTMRTIGI